MEHDQKSEVQIKKDLEETIALAAATEEYY